MKVDARNEVDELLLQRAGGLQAVYWMCSIAKTKPE